MTLAVKPAAGGILDQWSVMSGPVRIAIVAECEPLPILLRGELPADAPLAVVSRLIGEYRANQEKRAAGLKGGL